jgi:ribosomal protein L11 methyltransferase
MATSSLAVLTLQARFGELEGLSAELYSLGTLGIEEIELAGGFYELQAYFNEPFAAEALPGYLGWKAAEINEDGWRDNWQPRSIGHRLWLAPDWSTEATPSGRLKVVIRPGQGSGTSFSEPSLLMLEAMESLLHAADSDTVVLDVGTGSGILSGAARALGAGRVLACDVDETAAREAQQNQAEVAVWCGSPRSLQSGAAHFVLANINAIQLIELAPDLLRTLRPGGRLLLGGFTARNVPALSKVFGEPEEYYVNGEDNPWRCMVIRKPIPAE